MFCCGTLKVSLLVRIWWRSSVPVTTWQEKNECGWWKHWENIWWKLLSRKDNISAKFHVILCTTTYAHMLWSYCSWWSWVLWHVDVITYEKHANLLNLASPVFQGFLLLRRKEGRYGWTRRVVQSTKIRKETLLWEGQGEEGGMEGYEERGGWREGREAGEWLCSQEKYFKKPCCVYCAVWINQQNRRKQEWRRLLWHGFLFWKVMAMWVM